MLLVVVVVVVRGKVRPINDSEKGTNIGHETKRVRLNKVDDEAYDAGRRANKTREDERIWYIVMREEERGMREEKSGNEWDSKPKHTSYLNLLRRPGLHEDQG